MKKTLMVAAILSSTLISALAMASSLSAQDQNLIKDTLSGYESKDFHGACSVSYERNFFNIKGTTGRRDTVGFPIHSIVQEGQILVLSYAFYDGIGEIVLRKTYNDEFLEVIAYYQDNEFDKDLATFCILHRHASRD